jgi:hypothetical protein
MSALLDRAAALDIAARFGRRHYPITPLIEGDIADLLLDVQSLAIDWVESELREGFPMRLRVEAEKVRPK